MAKNEMTEGTKQALELLRQADGPVTLQELNDMAPEGVKVATGHLTALKRRGYVETEKVEKEVTQVREVNVYSLNDEAPADEE